MRIAVFGGAFDPPHPGHIKLARSVSERVCADKTLIIPTGNAPHKSTQTPFETRFKLAQAAFPAYEVNNIENCSQTSYTVNTLEKLYGIYPDSQLFMIVGADVQNSLDSWKDPDRVRELCTIAAGERDSFSSTKIREKLSAKRYTHSINVAIMCGELSKSHGLNRDLSEKAYIAGLLHDIAKECSTAEMLTGSGFEPLGVEVETPKLWHAIAGARIVRDDFGIFDTEILDAIRWHTLGREGMSVVGQIVYIADKISAERCYDGVERLRELAFADLDLAVKEENIHKQRRLRQCKK
jgi:predicted HD superfamily hydrolase involved in NAD metabolism